MRCPFCGAPQHELRVRETRSNDTLIRRRRECSLCAQRFTTVETPVRDHQRMRGYTLLAVPKGSKLLPK